MRRTFIYLTSLSVVLFLSACEPPLAQEKNLVPQALLQNVAWSFSEPESTTASNFIDAVASYSARVKAPFNRADFTAESPVQVMNVKFSYGIQKTSGEWQTISVVERVEGSGTKLTNAEILLQIHRKAHTVLRTDDHHYFEGLQLLPSSARENVPTYEVLLGS